MKSQSRESWNRPASSWTCASSAIASLDLRRQLAHPRQHLGDLLREHRAADLREVHREDVLRHHLGRERLGRRHADLRTGVHVDHAVGLARERRADGVRHGEQAGTLATRVPGSLERVDRLAGLRDGERERVGPEDRIPVAELARDVDLDRQAGPVLDRVLRDETRVVRGAAGDDEDLVDLAQDVVGDAEVVEGELSVLVDAPDQRVPDRARLLVDLLQHEGVEAALLRSRDVPVDRRSTRDAPGCRRSP